MTGQKTLNKESGKVEGNLDFIDEEEEEKGIEGEIKPGEEANIVKIVTQNLVEKYSQDARVLR